MPAELELSTEEREQIGVIYDIKTKEKRPVTAEDIIPKGDKQKKGVLFQEHTREGDLKIKAGFTSQILEKKGLGNEIARVETDNQGNRLQGSALTINPETGDPEIISVLGYEKIEGAPLDQSNLEFGEATQAIRQVAEILKHFEEEGYVHSDVHPGNILYDKDKKRVKLIDLELSQNPNKLKEFRSLGRQQEYSSPERIIEEFEDTRSEIFSLTMSLLESLPIDKSSLKSIDSLTEKYERKGQRNISAMDVLFSIDIEKVQEIHNKFLEELKEEIEELDIDGKIKIFIKKNLSSDKANRFETWEQYIKGLEICSDETKSINDLEEFIEKIENDKERRKKRCETFIKIEKGITKPTQRQITKVIDIGEFGGLTNASTANEDRQVNISDIERIQNDTNIQRHIKEDQINRIQTPTSQEATQHLMGMEEYIELSELGEAPSLRKRTTATIRRLLKNFSEGQKDTSIENYVIGIRNRFENPEDFLKELMKSRTANFKNINGYENMSSEDLKEIILEENAVSEFIAKSIYGKRYEYQAALSWILKYKTKK